MTGWVEAAAADVTEGEMTEITILNYLEGLAV